MLLNMIIFVSTRHQNSALIAFPSCSGCKHETLCHLHPEQAFAIARAYLINVISKGHW